MFIQFPEVEGVVSLLADSVILPRMRTIKQLYDSTHIESVESYVSSKLNSFIADPSWFQGKSICITAGSRGIPDLDRILRTICSHLRIWGAEPFIIPAMGSHGGGTAEGQRALLEGYNITEASVGAPIRATM